MPATSSKSTPTPSKYHGRTPAESGTERNPARDLGHYLKEYAREQPGVAAAWCLGIGFIVGWRLKPW